jgi:lysophosphatidate acyltransferase
MMAKKSLQFSPLGPFMFMSGSVFVDRGNSASARRSLEAAAATIKSEKVGLWAFVEGTRNNAEIPDLLPFKKGAFHLAVQGQIPIVPVVAENYWNMYHSGHFGTGKIKVKGTSASNFAAISCLNETLSFTAYPHYRTHS